jgi:hypothetical protein
VNNNCSKKFLGGRFVQSITRGLLAALAVLAVSGITSAQDKKDEITFNLLPNPAVVDCLRANPFEEPRARATVIRGKLNDTLILDLDGIKPGLAFDLFTVQNSFFQANGTKDPSSRVASGWPGISPISGLANKRITAMSRSKRFFWTIYLRF